MFLHWLAEAFIDERSRLLQTPRFPEGTMTRRLAVTALVLATACHRRTAAATGDTLRGIIAVVGTDRDHHVIVRPAGGDPVTLTGAEADLAARAAGADVWVEGWRDERTTTMSVTRFAVRAVDGIPAVDGTLAAADGGLVLITPDGTRHAIAHVPDALRERIGARVWISGKLDQGPVSFGVIQAKP
jgi:hypothetical protein